ncbi:hypothetical protein DTO212C5_7050 [Paecilomyces variotii]|nr:hypothetical protein DTO212C5_7050 [Paecilomyces variotii]
MDTTSEIAPELNATGRAELIEELSTMTGISMVDSATWSCFWFADVERLQQLVDMVRESQGGGLATSLTTRTLLGPLNVQALRSWAARGRKTNNDDDSTPGTPQTPRKRRAGQISSEEVASSELVAPFKRSKAAKKLCLERDQETCIITKAGEPVEVCHIFPFNMGGPATQEHFTFWATLSTFWTEDRIDAWKKQIFGDSSTEVCQNLLTLCPNAHKLWGKARFAFQPVSMGEDGKSLKVRFFWLQSRGFARQMSITTRPYLPAALDSGPRHAKLFNCLSETKVCSGDEFILTTDDPERKPLPSIELLEMQWTLQRLTAISGAADVNDEDLDDSDDDDDDDDGLSVQGPSYETSVSADVSGEHLDDSDNDDDDDDDDNGEVSVKGPSETSVLPCPSTRGTENQPPHRPADPSSKLRENDPPFTSRLRPPMR